MLCHSIVSSSLYLNQLMFLCFSRLKLCDTSINHCKIFCVFRSFYQLIVLLQAHQYNIFLTFTCDNNSLMSVCCFIAIIF